MLENSLKVLEFNYKNSRPLIRSLKMLEKSLECHQQVLKIARANKLKPDREVQRTGQKNRDRRT